MCDVSLQMTVLKMKGSKKANTLEKGAPPSAFKKFTVFSATYTLIDAAVYCTHDRTECSVKPTYHHTDGTDGTLSSLIE